jgi:serine/threonine-protein kinase PRP4
MASSASSDEGEISDVGVEKATTMPPKLDGTSVDRQDRNRSRKSISMSPEHNYGQRDRRSNERSRSPYSDRASRGAKRNRDDDYLDRSRDPRRFKVHYEDNSSDYRRRPRVSYEDLDRGPATYTGLSYDERDRYSDNKRPRTRSRSPYRANRGESYNHGGHGRRDAERYAQSGPRGNRFSSSNGNGETRNRDFMDQSVSKRGHSPLPTGNTRQEAKSAQGYLQQSFDKSSNNNDVAKYGLSPYFENNSLTRTRKSVAFANASEKEVAEEEPLDEATLIEQRRKRREAIKAKYRGAATPLLVQALQLGDKTGDSTPTRDDEDSPSAPRKHVYSLCESYTNAINEASPATPSTPAEIQDAASPSAFAVNNDLELANTNGQTDGDEDGPSAADYDPTADMREDNQRDVKRHTDEVSSTMYDETKPTTEQDVLLPAESTEAQVQPVKETEEFDMFAEEDDDMFAEKPVISAKPVLKAPEDVAKAVAIPGAKELDIGMLDNWDDIEGYYKVILGELLNSRYHVQANLGKGMFSSVVRATDVTTKKLVAIKLIRNNETM